jgi:hypothetical protein
MRKQTSEKITRSLLATHTDIKLLHEDPENVRLHPERNIEGIKASLARFGQQAPAVFVRRGGKLVVIKGNGMLLAARALGWKHLAAVESGPEGAEAKAFAIADNRTTDLSEFDSELLAAQLEELEIEDVDLASMGFSEAEMADLVKMTEDPPAKRGPKTKARHRGERTAMFLIGHLKFEITRKDFDAWLSAVEAKSGSDPDAVIREVKRRLKIG